MSRQSIVMIGLLCIAAGSAVRAQVGRDRVERATDRGQLARDGTEQNRDAVDLARLEALASRFDLARKHGDEPSLKAIDAELRGAAEAEIHESEAEMARDRAEVRQSAREAGSDRRELRRDRTQGRRYAVKADDRHDLRDDRRDLEDDREDLAATQRAQERYRSIARELSGLAGAMDEHSLDRKRALLSELIALARKEKASDAVETREDRRELREDRRETREDLRQRR